MKQSDLKKLALLGISSGLLVSSQLSAADTESKKQTSIKKEAPSSSADNKMPDPNNGNMGYHLMTEDELMIELNPSGVEMYNSLTPEGKLLARKVASMRCNGTNQCKGLNACETEHNKCAGKGSCKGKGKCAVSDKNLAVKMVRDKMAQKRSDAAP